MEVSGEGDADDSRADADEEGGEVEADAKKADYGIKQGQRRPPQQNHCCRSQGP